MAAQHDRVQLLLTRRGSTDADRARIIRGASEHLGTRVNQKKLTVTQYDLGIRSAVVNDSAIRASRGDRGKTEIVKAFFPAVFLMQHLGIGSFTHRLRSGNQVVESR